MFFSIKKKKKTLRYVKKRRSIFYFIKFVVTKLNTIKFTINLRNKTILVTVKIKVYLHHKVATLIITQIKIKMKFIWLSNKFFVTKSNKISYPQNFKYNSK